jgi:two-component system OmpR family sensor kinase
MSLRLRVTLLVTAVVGIAVVLLGTGVYLAFQSRLVGEVEVRLEHAADALSGLLDSRAGQPPAPIPTRIPGDPGGDVIIVLGYDASGHQVALGRDPLAPSIAVPDAVWKGALDDGRRLATVTAGDQSYRVTTRRLAGPAPVATPDGPSALRAIGLAQSLASADQALASLRLPLVLGGIVTVLVAAAAAALLATRAVRPVSDLVSAAETLGAGGELSRRLPVPQTKDEIARLSVAFNSSLERVENAYRSLEASLAQQRRFVADASHELRTPLTAIRTSIEGLRRYPGMPAAKRAVALDEAVEEAERMTRLLEDLLALARSDAGVRLTSAPLDWDELVHDVANDAQRLCDPRRVEVRVAEPLGPGLGDAEALRRVMRILFDNIARHTPADTSVTLTVTATPTLVRIEVADDGPGAPRDLLPHIFDRFTQADLSRRNPGSGLGLAIARSIVEAHHGQVTASAVEPHGLSIIVAVPREPNP